MPTTTTAASVAAPATPVATLPPLPRDPAPSREPFFDMAMKRGIFVLCVLVAAFVIALWAYRNVGTSGTQNAGVIGGPDITTPKAPPVTRKKGVDVDRFFKSDGYLPKPDVKDGPDGNYARFFKEAKQKPHPDCVEISTFYSKERGEATTRYSCPRTSRK